MSTPDRPRCATCAHWWDDDGCSQHSATAEPLPLPPRHIFYR